MRGEADCIKPNSYVNDEQRREILRNYQGNSGFEDDCDEIDVVRDWPTPECAGLDESYSSRPTCDESIIPVPNRGNVRNMEFVPPPNCQDVKDRNNGSSLVAVNRNRVRANARRRPRRYGRIPRRNMLMKMPDVASRGFLPSKQLFDQYLSEDAVAKSMPVLVLLGMLSLALIAMKPKMLMHGLRDIYAQNERACGYFLAAASYVLILATKDLVKSDKTVATR